MKINKSKVTGWLCLLLILGATGCATIDGAGKDIESAGEAVQDASDTE